MGVNKTNDEEEPTVPQSYCSNRCKKGQATIHHGDGCCWSCSNCSRNSITIINQTVCVDCGDLYAPNFARNECIKIIPTFTEWGDPWAVAIVSIDCLGLICASAVLCAYVLNNNHPLIKASSRELSYMMLIGVFLSYLLVFSLIAKPSYATCYIIRIGYMMCFTITYAPILTRANRIYRIFKAGKKSTKRPGCISPHSQVVIALSLIMVQCGINITFLWKTPPHPDEQPVDGNVELTCKTDHLELIVSLSYNLTLIVLCSAHAFMTRKVPTNYNESRFISLSVYTTLVIWLGFIPCYFIVPYSHLQVVVMSAAMMVSATVSMVFMYVPKLYAIYFVQEVDVHAGTYRESRSMDESMTERPSIFGGTFKLPIRSAAVAPATHKTKTVTESVAGGDDGINNQVGNGGNITEEKESRE
ncbi:metabotropic glutamate receptor 2-like [Amphiura filiformis]|uniref:metabotropic glutamate receptor 2-like n=1 Tax=Amphiura filiformis TaxID=82378 RepID=UPI003B222F13